MTSCALDAHDDTTIALATWATGLRRDTIPSAAARALAWHHLDSVGCAAGAIDAPPCREVAWSEIGGGQDDHAQKWDPRHRETADHSLPYMCAVALVDGRLQAESYLPERFLDPSLRPLMNKIEVVEDPDITADWTRVPAHDITIRLVSGETRHIRAGYPRGHPGNPATEAELTGKFKGLLEPVAGLRRSDDLLGVLRDLDALTTLAPMFDALRALESAP